MEKLEGRKNEGRRLATGSCTLGRELRRWKLRDLVNRTQGKRKRQSPGFLQTEESGVTEKVTQGEGRRFGGGDVCSGKC